MGPLNAIWHAELALRPLLTVIRSHADWAGIYDVRDAVKSYSGDSGLDVLPVPANKDVM